mmetsp:Transcript_3894/g.7451  ORF Transcript_3894/g.7451 Transcript_3894/m.7451 type:complete len:213 (+) Transcript_3894:2455-3093(+)
MKTHTDGRLGGSGLALVVPKATGLPCPTGMTSAFLWSRAVSDTHPGIYSFMAFVSLVLPGLVGGKRYVLTNVSCNSLGPRAAFSTWRCVRNCGACCYLSTDERDVEGFLGADDLEEYLDMIGADGWCVHFDKDERTCSKYLSRPKFCRVELPSWKEMFGVESQQDMEELAVQSCLQWIGARYGEGSIEENRFLREIGDSFEVDDDAHIQGNP